MRSKKLVALSGAVLAAVLLVGAVGATAVFAQEPEPEAEPAMPFMGRRTGPGGIGGRLTFGDADQPWARYDKLAEALGLTPEELFAELREGMTVDEIAEEQGVDLEALREEWAAEHKAEREQAMRDAIAQAIEDGEITQEQADWLLEGLDNDYLEGLRSILGGHGRGGPMGRGGRMGPGGHGRAPAADDAGNAGTSG